MLPITISEYNLANAYESVIQYIVENGYYQLSEDNEHTIETNPITIYVDTPFRQDRLSKYSPQKEMSVKEYTNQLINGTPGCFEYDYHNQLFNWGGDHMIHGVKTHHNQIAWIKEKLRAEPYSRRAITIIFDPDKHQYTTESVPCAQLMQFIIRNGQLHQRIVFRSNDMLTAVGANMYAFTALGKSIADDLNISYGSYTHIALTPHIYYIRDADKLETFINGVNKQKIFNNSPQIKTQTWMLQHIDNFKKYGRIENNDRR